MQVERMRAIIKIVSGVWMVVVLGLVALIFAKLIDRDLGMWLFAGGFVVWSLVVTVLTLALNRT
jgi:hypothetical protein